MQITAVHAPCGMHDEGLGDGYWHYGAINLPATIGSEIRAEHANRQRLQTERLDTLRQLQTERIEALRQRDAERRYHCWQHCRKYCN